MFSKAFRKLFEASAIETSNYDKKDSLGHYMGVRRQRGELGPTNRKQGIGPSIGAKNQSMVPDYWKADANANEKVERMKNHPGATSGRMLLNKLDVQDICDTYKIKNLSPEEPRECGTTGIVIRYDQGVQRYCLTKK